MRAKQLSPSCEPSRRTKKRDCFSHGEYECVSQQRQNAATELEEIEESGRWDSSGILPHVCVFWWWKSCWTFYYSLALQLKNWLRYVSHPAPPAIFHWKKWEAPPPRIPVTIQWFFWLGNPNEKTCIFCDWNPGGRPNLLITCLSISNGGFWDVLGISTKWRWCKVQEHLGICDRKVLLEMVHVVLPLCSNPFCKWFWSGFWVPKHLLAGHLEH